MKGNRMCMAETPINTGRALGLNWNGHFLNENIEKPFIRWDSRFFDKSDPVGIQTQDLQNRNLTLYSAKLRDLFSQKRVQRYEI